MDIEEKKFYSSGCNLELLNKKGISIDGCIDKEDVEEVEALARSIDWDGKNDEVRDKLADLGVTVVANHDRRMRLICE